MLAEIPVSLDALRSERPAGSATDDHFCTALAHAVISEFTAPGEIVLDPFAGWGTTLTTSLDLGRRAVGIELSDARADHIDRLLGDRAILLRGDARARVAEVGPDVALCLTSPPYMTSTGHPENPFTAYRTRDGVYQTYLADLERLFLQVAERLLPRGHVVVNVADQGSGETLTPLVSDVAESLSRCLRFERAIPVVWDEIPPGSTNDTCLVFAKVS